MLILLQTKYLIFLPRNEEVQGEEEMDKNG